MPQQTSTFAFGGGLDTNSAALAVAPSLLISAMNYEPLAEGYGRIDGYERFDGRTAPSACQYWTLGFDGGTIAIVSGNTVTGNTSGATGILVTEPYGLTGSWGAGTAAGTLILVALTGTFLNNEPLNVAGVAHALANGVAVASGASTIDLDETWLELAQAYHRALIAKPPGQGPVRGGATINGVVYAWRDNVGATQLLGYRATAAGWVALTTSRRIAFTAGNNEILDGAALLGVTSGATATAVRVVVTSGDWGSSDAAGWIHITGQTGVFGTETVKAAGVNSASIVASVANTFAPGGRVRAIRHNFYGAADRYRIYGTTATGYGFELNGNAMIPILTGMAIDTPTYVFEIGNSLGFTFAGGSVQVSGTGEPLQWQPILGAGEIGLGTEVTDVVQANETAVALFGEQKVAVLTGNDVNNFALDTLTEEAGADADSAQRIARTVYLDRRGVRTLDATQAFGDFKAGALSGRFEKYLKAKRAAGATVIGSFTSRTKSQYRLVWNDGTGFALYMGGKQPEMIPFEYGDMRPTSFWTGELAGGEAIFCGGEDGYVYRLDSGTNQDGDRIHGFCMMPFNHFGAIMQEKRYHKVTLELDGPPRARIGITAQFDYNDGNQPIAGQSNFFVVGAGNGNAFLVTGGGGSWDSAVWDEFYWSEPVAGTAECYGVEGVGRNASFIFATQAGLTERPHILQAYSVHHSPRKMKR